MRSNHCQQSCGSLPILACNLSSFGPDLVAAEAQRLTRILILKMGLPIYARCGVRNVELTVVDLVQVRDEKWIRHKNTPLRGGYLISEGNMYDVWTMPPLGGGRFL